jgi:membrane protein DedA with SNARE-associated domain
MPSLMQLIQQFGLLLVFANVFVEQLGVPVPALPTMVAAGALSAFGAWPFELALAVTTSACVIADCVWYAIGRRAGRRALSTLCTMSWSPRGCPERTERRLRRLGPKAIVLAKFVPGLGLLTNAMAGALGMRAWRFVVFDVAGSVSWTGLNLFLGWWLHDSVASVLGWLERTGRWGLGALAGLVALAIVAKLWRATHLRRKRLASEATAP